MSFVQRALPETAAIQVVACNGDIVMVSLHQVAQAYARLQRNPASSRVVDIIQNACCVHFGISRKEMLSPRRSGTIVRARHVAMYLAKLLTECSFPEIGRCFRDRDHTTVLHACRKITRLAKTDRQMKLNLAALELIISRETIEAERGR